MSKRNQNCQNFMTSSLILNSFAAVRIQQANQKLYFQIYSLKALTSFQNHRSHCQATMIQKNLKLGLL